MTTDNEVSGFTVARVDRHGRLPRTYLRASALAGRNGLHHLAFGSLEAPHVFERRAQAEDIARRLRRRILAADHDYLVEELSHASVASP